MVSPLQDLANRLASNTLTVLQQSAFAQALAIITPAFETPSPQGGQIPSPLPEAVLAREWMAVLYAIQSEGGGGGGGTVLPTNQTVWFIDPVAGNDANNGLTSATALKTIAALATLWKGTAGGGRPQLNPSTGTTITITMLNNAPATDPLAPILDVDLAGGMTLVIQGTGVAPSKTSTFTTISAFARTHAGGQQTFTDATVANYGVFVPSAMLVQSTTAPRAGVAWLVGPNPGASATATTSPFYSPQVAGTPSVPTLVAPNAADGYTLTTCIQAFWGNGCTTRQFPQDPQTGTAINSQVVLYRMHFPLPSDPNDSVSMSGNPGVAYVLQECQGDIPVSVTAGASVTAVNCLDFQTTGYVASAGGSVELIAGASSNGTNPNGPTPRALAGGTLIVDCDHALYAMGSAFEAAGGQVDLGNCSHWGTTASTGFLFVVVDQGKLTVNPIFQATSVVYGSDGGQFCSVGSGTAFANAICTYSQTGSGTPCADQFKSTNTAFLLGRLPSTSAWGISPTTGLAVGATTNTIAHMDAALAAGTGFGSLAADPGNVSYFGVAG